MEVAPQSPGARAGWNLEDVLAALAEALSVFAARLREPKSKAPATPSDASPPNRDYF